MATIPQTTQLDRNLLGRRHGVYRPHAGQAEFHRDASLAKVALSGIGGGKTAAGAFEALMLARANAGLPGVVAAPTYQMLQAATLPAFLSLLRPSDVLGWSARDRLMTLTNGAQIWFRSAEEPDYLYGPNLAWFWLDEAALCDEAAWDVLFGRVRLDCRRPAAVGTCTPRGFNWVWKRFHSDPPAGHRLHRWSARLNSPNLRPGFFDDLYAAYDTHRIRQDVEGEFIGHSALVYGNFSRGRNIVPWRPDPAAPIDVAVDFGFRHPYVCWIAEDVASDPARFVVFDEFAPSDCTLDRLIETIRTRGYKLRTIACDPAGVAVDGYGSSAVAEFARAGLQCTFTNRTELRNILTGVEIVRGLLLNAMDQTRLVLAAGDRPDESRVPVLQRALESYSYPEDSSSRSELPVKDNVHDHPVDALRYWAVNQAASRVSPFLMTG